MKKLFPWIPIIGIPLTVLTPTHETNLNNRFVFWGSAFVQGVTIALLILHYITLINNLN